MLHFELNHPRLNREKEQEQLTQANQKLLKLQEVMGEHIQVLLEEMKAFEEKVEANPASEPESLRRRFLELKEQANILAQNLDHLLSA
ncbi:hypothetical protein [Rufibacter tibetensis]|uniref:Uncharacterized protein n=1 Tax=Rufibacter tibetensis TaxID=512763 RepID=A0A0P0C1B4_9BACT|nr:hypothetical protein [Rufibacter tibetensis]ALI98375.1 hypothetical protein DC20_04515 [Rufibacter tibetensis]